MFINLLFLTVSFIFGVIVSSLSIYFLCVRPSHREIKTERSRSEAYARENVEYFVENRRIPSLEGDNEKLREELSEVKGILKAEQQSHLARVSELEKMGKEIEQKFTVLASEALGKNSESFLTLVSERFDRHKETSSLDLENKKREIENLVSPLIEGLGKFDRKIEEIEKAREGAYSSISEQVQMLGEGQMGLREETHRLVQALRNPNTRGRWGEYHLKNVLEMSGLTEHVDFIEKPTVGGLRPDVVVYLPEGKSVVIDAKTPLEAYLDSIDAKDDKERKNSLKRHSKNLLGHVKDLSSKDYWKNLQGSPDFVIMFIPVEACLASGLEYDKTIFEEAIKNKVILATPMTLVALVKSISYGWQQKKISDSIQEVSKVSRELFDRVQVFGKHMNGIGSALGQAVGKYNDAVGSFERRVVPVGKKLGRIGVVPKGEVMIESKKVEERPKS